MGLHASGEAAPTLVRTSDGRQKFEMWMFGREMLEFLAVEKTARIAHTEQERDVWLRARKMIQQHGTERRDTSAGRDEDSAAAGMSKREVAERLMHFDFVAGIEFKQPTRDDAGRHAIQTKRELITRPGRSNRVGAGDLFPV